MSIQIYVACLASYNNGVLYGRHIEIHGNTEIDDVHAEISAMLSGSRFPGAEEYAVHDYDYDPDDYGDMSAFGEHPDLEKLIEHVRLCDEHGPAWLAYVENVGSHYATETDFKEKFCGEFNSRDEWAYEYMSEVYDIPELLENYIDYEKFANHCETCGDIDFVEHGGKVYVFNAH